MRYLLLILGAIPLWLSAQTETLEPCGTPHTKLVKLLTEHAHEALTIGDSVGTLLVKAYVFTNSPIQYSPGQADRLINAIDETNQLFSGSGIQFALCGDLEYVDSVAYGFNDFYEWQRAHVDPRMINIFSGSVPFYCGVAFSVGGGDLSNTAIVCNTGETVAHEFGHLLGLHHTFHPISGQMYSQELVDGSNCDTTGDGVCDTPADPYPLGGNLDSCQYVGTVTDANGDLYTPHIQNNMSYYSYQGYGCGEEEFTEGQFARMRGIVGQDLFYLLKLPDSTLLPEIDGAPRIVCVGDSTHFTLSSNVPGGSFSGDGVNGNDLFLGNLPVGVYEIEYQLPPPQPVAPYSKVDYAQIVYGYGGEPDPHIWWQGFKAGESAPLEAIRLRASASVDEPFQWAIYAGIGTQGTPLIQQADTFGASPDMRWRRFSLGNALQQAADSVYTLAFWTDSSSTLDVDKVYQAATNVQELGSINDSTGPFPTAYYPCFVTEISSTRGVCQGPIKRRIHVVAPREFPYAVEDNFCIGQGEVAIMDLIPVEATWSYPEFSFEVNQQPDSLLRLEDLGPGNHTLTITNIDYNGCAHIVSHPVQVIDIPQVSVPETFCADDDVFSLSSLWPDGEYWLNGWNVDSIRPDQLPEGSYMLDMYLPNVFDTLTVPDQELLYGDSGIVGYFLTQDSVFWQSFRPDSAYFFQSAAFRLGILDSIQIVGSLWKGAFATGTLILRDTSWLLADPNGTYPDILRTLDLDYLLTPDSLYTVAMEPLYFAGHQGVIIAAKADPYTPGEASPIDTLNPHLDFLFKVFHQRERQCGSNRQHPFSIISEPNPPISFLDGPDTVALGSTVSYAWSGSWADSLWLTLSGATCLNCPVAGDSIQIQWNEPGQQQIAVSAANTCGEAEVIRDVWVEEDLTSLSDLYHSSGVKVFPNPFLEVISISIEQGKPGPIALNFYDLRGRLIDRYGFDQRQAGEVTFEYSTGHLPPGSYLLEVQQGGTASRHLMVKR